MSVLENRDISTKRRYSAEFKKEAVRLILIEGHPAREVADELGVARNLLYRWKSDHVEELEAESTTGERSPREMAAEIEDLRKRLRSE